MTKRLLYLAILCVFSARLYGGVLYVPADFAGIQSAIDAASDGDTIRIEAGVYNERLTIDKSLSLIGAGQETCIISDSSETSPIVSIRGGTVALRHLEINGGFFNGDFHEGGPSPVGLRAEETQLTLQHVQLRMLRNYMIEVRGGSCRIEDVALSPGIDYFQCDIGLDLMGADAEVRRLTHLEGNIDHIINIDAPDGMTEVKTVTIDSCTLRASALSWGDCIRSYGYSKLVVAHSLLYREPGGQPANADNHTGIGVNGPYVDLVASDNVFEGVPWGISVYGSINGSNRARIEKNIFQNCEIGGVRLYQFNYEGFDLGGGVHGGAGLNVFSGSALYDLKMEDTTIDVFALNNGWGYVDPDIGIYDQLDEAGLGRVIYQTDALAKTDLALPPDGDRTAPVPPLLAWHPVRGALFYRIQVSQQMDFSENIEEATVYTDTTYAPTRVEAGQNYWWRVRAANNLVQGEWSDAFSFQANYPAGVADERSAVQTRTAILRSAYPNPFNSAVTLQFELTHRAFVSVRVYNINGEQVSVLQQGTLESGMHRLTWNADSVPSGLYVLRATMDDYVETQKIILMR